MKAPRPSLRACAGSWGLWVVVLVLVALPHGGCRATKPAAIPERPTQVPEAFSPPADEVADAEQKVQPDRWWTAFGDEHLDELVDCALEGNLDLEALWQRILEARALATRERSPLYPQVDGFAGTEIANRDGIDLSNLDLGLLARYEVDLYRRLRSAADAERLRSGATAAEYHAGAITLAATVATTFYQMREAELQLDLLDEQLAFNEKIEELIAARVATQQLRGVDLLRQRELSEATREQRIVVSAQQRLLENQLAVLVGRSPGPEFAPPAPEEAVLPEPPPPPSTGLPIELVRRRPDIRAARYRACAANQDLRVALNDIYPRLNLTAGISSIESSSGDIFREWLNSFSAGLIAPLFDGGRRRSEMRRSWAIRDRLLAEYGQQVLIAFQEVEDALVREDGQRKRLASLERQAELSRETTSRLRTSNFEGVGNYIDVLAALTDNQRLERDLLTNRRLLLDARIALYRALAGSFETWRERRQGC